MPQNHQKWLPRQIVGGNPVKNVQIQISFHVLLTSLGALRRYTTTKYALVFLNTIILKKIIGILLFTEKMNPITIRNNVASTP